jgi:hypothetical protein
MPVRAFVTRASLLALLLPSAPATAQAGSGPADLSDRSPARPTRAQVAAARRAARDPALGPEEREVWRERVLDLVARASRGATSSRAATSEDGAWRRIPSPTQRLNHAAVYDPVRERMLVIGGRDWWAGLRYDDVWALSLGDAPAWAAIEAEGGSPGERHGHTAIYDPVRDRVVVFGGWGPEGRLDDLWELSLAGTPAWTRLAPQGSLPAARHGHAAIYDPVRDRMVVFGGAGSQGALDDVWELSLAGTPTWTQLAPGGTPPAARSRHVAIHDPARDRMVIFGGSDAEAWELSLTGTPLWTRLEPQGTPPATYYAAAAVHDPVADRLVVFGGAEGGTASRRVWALTLGAWPAWSEIAPGGAAPPERSHQAAIYDPQRDRMLVFAGENLDFIALRDVWSLSLDGTAAWTQWLPAGASPGERDDHAAIWDPVRGRMLVHGGRSEGYGGVDGGVWALAPDGDSGWSGLETAGTPPGPRAGHAAIYDPVRDRLVMFGGHHEATGLLGDVWTLSLGDSPAWTQLAPAGTSPAPRRGHEAVYDPVRDRMIVLGGSDGTSFDLGDVWELSLDGTPTWTPLAPAGTPPGPRHDGTAIYDPVRDRIVVFGGVAGPGEPPSSPALDDVWALSLAGTPTWTQLTPAGDPPGGRWAHSAIYDPVRDRMVIFGGGETWDDVWALSLGGSPKWTALLPEGGAPRWRGRHTAIYDRAGDRMVAFAGGDLDLVSLNDVWSLGWSPTTLGPPAARAPDAVALHRPRPHPIRPGGRIAFDLARPASVQLSLYDPAGRLLGILAEGPLPAGRHQVPWTGSGLRPGVYYLEMRADGARRGQSLVVVR